MPLGGHPEFTMTIWSNAGKAGVRFDIPLVRLFGLVAFFNDDVSLCKTGIDITVSKLTDARDVRW